MARRDARTAIAALAQSEGKLHALTQHLERAKEDERRANRAGDHGRHRGALNCLKFDWSGSRVLCRMAGVRPQLDAMSQLLESASSPAIGFITCIASGRARCRPRGRPRMAGARIFRAQRIEVDLQATAKTSRLRRTARLPCIASRRSADNIASTPRAKRVHMHCSRWGMRYTPRNRRRWRRFRHKQLAGDSRFWRQWNDRRARGLGAGQKYLLLQGRGTTVMFSIPHTRGSIHPRGNRSRAMAIICVRGRRSRDSSGAGLCRSFAHPECRSSAEASDYTGLRNELKKHGEPDVLVMDVGLPGKNGIDILKALRDEHPKLKVLIVSMYPEDQYAVRAFRAGAFGYLNKASAPEKLLEALAQVVSGRKYVTPEIAQALVENLNAPDADSAPHEKLSDREFQTLKLIASGKRLSEIAEALALSPKTVSVYRARILEKMAMGSNAELTHYAIKNGLVE